MSLYSGRGDRACKYVIVDYNIIQYVEWYVFLIRYRCGIERMFHSVIRGLQVREYISKEVMPQYDFGG